MTCFETLEHVGNYENAFRNLFTHLRAGGILITTVPNETRLVGLVKFMARPIFNRKAYGRFFETRSCLKYLLYLMADKNIEEFRTPGRRSHGPHLGFDYRKLREHVEQRYVATNLLAPVIEVSTFARMNVVAAFEKHADPRQKCTG